MNYTHNNKQKYPDPYISLDQNLSKNLYKDLCKNLINENKI